MKKKVKDRVAASTSFTLDYEEPYDTFIAQVLAQISKTLSPKTISIDEYIITYTIKRVENKPISLKSEQDFSFLLERAATTNKPDIKLVIVQKPPKAVSN